MRDGEGWGGGRVGEGGVSAGYMVSLRNFKIMYSLVAGV
jgi:hypothetical protein